MGRHPLAHSLSVAFRFLGFLKASNSFFVSKKKVEDGGSVKMVGDDFIANFKHLQNFLLGGPTADASFLDVKHFGSLTVFKGY
jgi:hypothetical protein